MWKALIVVPGFTTGSREPIKMLQNAGFEVLESDYGLAGLNNNEPEFCRIVKGVDVLIVTAMDRVTRRVIENADKLKMVAIRSAGFEGTDLKAATDHGVLVTHNPGANRQPVADMTMGLMLSVSKRIGLMDRGMRSGGFNEVRVTAKDIYQRRLGIIGLGNIGKAVAQRAKGFDMKVIYHDIVAYPDFADAYGIEKVSLDQLLCRSDIITLHVPLDDSTRAMIGASQIQRMKKGVILINTCRGGVVDEKAVYSALVSGHLYGYGTDVHETEPPAFLDLLRHDHVTSTPHVAGASQEGLNTMAATTVRKVIQFIKDKIVPENVLNPDVLTRLRT
jgi:phosphoglycerate dehydrogenase-like enzyme